MILLRDFLGTASLIELLWVAAALGGLYLAGVNAWESVLDFRALGGKRNGRYRLALGTIRREAIRGLVNAIFFGIGIVAVVTPASPNISPLGVAVSLGLLLASLAYNANSALDRADRIYLMRHGLQSRDEHGKFTKGE